MKSKLLIFILMSLSLTSFAQEKYPYRYNLNNISCTFQIRGLFDNMPYRIQWFVADPVPENQNQIAGAEIIEVFRESYESKALTGFTAEVKDIPGGTYGVGFRYPINDFTDGVFITGRVYNYKLSAKEKHFININDNE